MDFQGGAVVPARPDSFLLFFILIPVLFVMVKRYWRGRKDLNAIGGKWRSRLLMDVFLIKWFFSSLVFILFIIFSILSLAEFTGRGKVTVESSSGIDIVFAVDISGSMLGTDIYPSRLKRSVDLISAFLENLHGERFGLVVFKGAGIKILPITEDSSAVSSVLPYLDPDMFSSEGSNLEDGIITALNSFTAGEERKKIILLFTDGESLSGSTSMSAEYAKDQDVNIIIFGTGTEAGTELYRKGGEPLLDEGGEIVISRLNSTLLKGLSSAENIIYLDISDSSVLHDSLLLINKQLESNVIFDQKETHYRFFLSVAILFLFFYISVRIFPWKNTF
jgi:Ca-activated chloride channel family protein